LSSRINPFNNTSLMSRHVGALDSEVDDIDHLNDVEMMLKLQGVNNSGSGVCSPNGTIRQSTTAPATKNS